MAKMKPEPKSTAGGKMRKNADNEKIKLRATFYNNIAWAASWADS
jgi:hypothetical protein